MSQKYNQEAIDQEEQAKREEITHEEKKEAQQQTQQKKEEQKEIQHEQIIMERVIQKDESHQRVQDIHRSPIKHQEIGKYANITMEIQDEQQSQTKIKIIGTDFRGSTFTKYTVYIIKGYDKNGEISVSRRFSEFHAMRAALCKRWPGCFIPSIPQKNYMNKNDKDQITKRERYLNDFLYKITKLPHLYASEEFQALIRSGSEDISSVYDSWSAPSYESIINKYRECFSDLAGKQIDDGSNNTIAKFYASILKNQALIEKYRLHAKNLAIAKDRYNRHFPLLFSRIIPAYEQTLLAEYTNNKEEELVYLNSNQAKICENSPIINDISVKNPFWLLYDMLKHEQRDGKGFMQMIKSRENLESKRHALQVKIKENQKAIAQISEGKKNMKSMSSKNSNDEIKYKLEMQTEELKKQKNFLVNLLDIITALIVFIQIPTFKKQKIEFYQNVLKRIGGFEINSVQISGEVWQTTEEVAVKIDKNTH